MPTSILDDRAQHGHGTYVNHIPCPPSASQARQRSIGGTSLPAVLKEFAFKYARERLFKAFRLVTPQVCVGHEQPSLKREPYES
jgi:hypothetical protein